METAMRYLLLILLTGCAKLVDIDYSIEPPRDWPKLEERITYGTVEEVRRWCNMPKGMKAFNCATVSFKYGTCMIYLSTNDPAALAHERAHCQGYDHVGDRYRSHQAWERWKKGQ
jgi:hypothetical protein